MKRLIEMIAIVGMLATLVYAGDPAVRVWKSYDAAPVFRIQNSGTEVVSVTVTAGDQSVIITNGTVTTTIYPMGTLTVSSNAASIAAVTNSSGALTISVDYGPSLGADVFTNIITGTTVVPANKHVWTDGPKWDTSACLFYDVYFPSKTLGGVADAKIVRKLYGEAAGTGNITLAGYVDGAQMYQQTIVSPIYVAGASTSATNYVTVADSVTRGNLAVELNIPVAPTEGVMFRASRATTATTGGMGLTLDLVP